MAGLSWLRHRMEFPKFRASPRIERARVAGITRKHLADGCAQHDDILIDERNPVPSHFDIDHAVLTESLRCLSGDCINSHEPRSGRDHDSRRSDALTRPVANTTRRRGEAREFVFPNRLSGLRIECEDAAARGQIHDAVDDDWCRFGIHHRRWPAATPLTDTAAASTTRSKAALIIGLLLFTTSPGRRRRPEPIAPCGL